MHGIVGHVRSEQRTGCVHDARGCLAAIVESQTTPLSPRTSTAPCEPRNPAAERLFGYASAELIGQSVRILIPSDRQNDEDETLRKIRQGESVEHFETVRQSTDGQPIDGPLTVSPVRDAS